MATPSKKNKRNPPPRGIAKFAQIGRTYWLGPCAMACCVYLTSLSFGFVADDYTQIVYNPQVQSWDYLPRLLTTHLWSQKGAEHIGYFYRPLFSVWLLAIHTVGGLAPWFWHLSSIALHVLATYLVFKLCSALLESPIAASCAALLFAVHPIHVDAVSWISASNEILYAIFVLSSLLVLAHGSQTQPPRRTWLWVSVGLWSAALISKETATALLPMFFFLALSRSGQLGEWRARLRVALRIGTPYLLAAVIYLGVRWLVLHGLGPETGVQTWREVIYTSPSVIVFYLGKLLWPVRLSTFYLNPVLSAPTAEMWISVVLVVAGICLAAWLAKRYSSQIAFAQSLVILPLIPVLLGIRIYEVGNTTHDRYLYLPSVGLCLLFGLLARRLWLGSDRRKKILKALTLLLILALAWLTLSQQAPYKNGEAYYRRGIEANPNNVLVIDYLGNFYLFHGQLEQALEQFTKAHELAPENPNTTFFLARGLFANGQYGTAEPLLEQLSHSTRIRPKRRAIVLLSFGQAEVRLGHLSQAEEVLKQFAREDDSYPGLHDTLGALYQLEGRIPEAQREYVREVEVSGDPISRQKAERLARLMRGNAADPRSTLLR